MTKGCLKFISQLQAIKVLQSQLDIESDSFSNYQKLDRNEQIDKFIVLFKLRNQLLSQIYEVVNELRIVSLEQAEELIGKENFFGPKEIQTAFKLKNEIDPNQIPEIGFTSEELERAKKLNHFLILRIDQTTDGVLLTMEELMALKANKFMNGNKLLYDIGWYKNQDFFIKESIKLSWALVTREIVDNTTNKEYLQQYDVLISYLQNEVFKNQPLPKEYQEAIKEYNDQKTQIEAIVHSDWKSAAGQLENLKITKLLRRTPAEILYDIIVVADGRPDGQELLPLFDWSSRCDSAGSLLSVGNLNLAGADVFGNGPGNTAANLGACLSRKPFTH